jgi:NhaC family Na+:H+ antiporter
MHTASQRQPTLLDALLPVLLLALLLALSVYLYGDESSAGPNQIALTIGAGLALLVGYKNRYPWRQLEQGLTKGIAVAIMPILILFMVGALIGTWILAGTVPTMIYYGLAILHPSIFYLASCLICAVIAISIGSSWTTAGTVGVGLMGVAIGLGMSPAITAGAIISGAYFGDKLSPLSDTTNLAAAVSDSELFSHIRHMLWTTIPSLLIALTLFWIIGLRQSTELTSDDFAQIQATLAEQFHVAWYLLLPLVAVLLMAIKRLPAFPTLLIGALLGALFAIIFQWQQVIHLVPDNNHSDWLQALAGVWTALANGYQSHSGNAQIDDLLTRGGVSSMLDTVWLILSAMCFGAAMEAGDLLKRLVQAILRFAKSTGSLVGTTLLTCFGTNVVTGDQYIAIALPGRMFKLEFERRGLAPVNLSRTLEDSGTITSPLVPWNTCGAYMAATLGVATWLYLPFCFFNLVNPFIAALYGFLNFKILPMNK